MQDSQSVRIIEPSSDVQIIEKQMPVSPQSTDDGLKNDLMSFDQNQNDSPKAAANSPKQKKESLGWANDHIGVLEEKDTNKVIQ